MSYSDEYQKIRDIADAICEEQVTPEQIQQLELMLTGNTDAKRFYLDYMGIHTHLMSAADSNVEYVYRRLQTAEEFIIRPSGNTTSQRVTVEQASNSNEGTEPPVAPPLILTPVKNQLPRWHKLTLVAVTLLVVVSIATLIGFVLEQRSTMPNAVITSGHLSVVYLGEINNNSLSAGEYEVNQDAQITLANGEIIQLVKHSVFKLLNHNEIALKQGVVSLTGVENQHFVVRASNFSLYSFGGDLTLDLRADKAIVTSGDKTVLLPQRWRPMHYWPFESKNDRAIDVAGTAHGIVSFGAMRTKGLVGQGAFHFDNGFDARINVGSGGGTVPATGSFAVTDGVTIEALVVPNFSAEIGEMDEIFRKDQLDEELRMLLSFQHDKNKSKKTYLKPEGNYNESLSFGLYLVGQGYHELKLPLDGLNGRPTLQQINNGDPYHIVATYNVSSGLKAIYINGQQLAAYQYPPGSKILSGGAGAANIGNSPNKPVPVTPTSVKFAHNEAFSGVIDEVAFYNFALPAYMVNEHFQQFRQGFNYFGLYPDTQPLPEEIELTLPANSTLEIDMLTGLPDRISSK